MRKFKQILRYCELNVVVIFFCLGDETHPLPPLQEFNNSNPSVITGIFYP